MATVNGVNYESLDNHKQHRALEEPHSYIRVKSEQYYKESTQYEHLLKSCDDILFKAQKRKEWPLKLLSAISYEAGPTRLMPKESEINEAMKESMKALKSITPQDLRLSTSEITIGIGLVVAGFLLNPILGLIGFGSISLGILHLAWASKPK